MSEVTRILDAVQQGNANAADELLPLVYEELRKLAVSQMACRSESITASTLHNVHL